MGRSANRAEQGQLFEKKFLAACEHRRMDRGGLIVRCVRRRARLSRTIQSLKGAAIGLGIPSGAGVIVHPDTTIEPLRRPALEFRFEDSRVAHSLLFAND
jgi:hypothetical protein